MDLKIENKNVLIVGASKGIGRAIALAFAKEGGNVTTIARDEELLKSLHCEMCEMSCGKCHTYYVRDMMIESNVEFIQNILNERGDFDIVVQNIGGSLVSRNALGTYEEWLEAWRFNAGLAIELNHKLIPPMVQHGWGRVIHISSISAEMLRGNPLYASAKAFLNAYVKTVGRQLADKGVVMSSVMPGAVAFEGSYWDIKSKDFNKPESGGKSGVEICQDFLWHHQAANRFGTVEEIANVVLFMASEQCSFMQASCIPVDGANM